jgi:DNA-binding transcriptional MocR family regulator
MRCGCTEEALAQGISIAPGPIFSAKREFGPNYIRLNFGHPFDARVRDAVASLGRWVSEQARVSASGLSVPIENKAG